MSLLFIITFFFLSLRNYLDQWKQWFASIGLMMIFISIRFLDNHRIPPYPNVYTFLPTVGAALIILFADKTTLVGRLLSMNFLRWIGLISYSLYLWHQPVFAFVRLQSYHVTVSTQISITFFLGLGSYLFIEQPFRQKGRFSRRQIFCGTFFTTFITFLLAIFLIRTANQRSVQLTKNPDSYLYDLQKYGSVDYVIQRFNQFEQGEKFFSNQSSSSSKKKLILIGDSFAQDFCNIIMEGKYLSNYEMRVQYVSARCQIYIGSEDRRQFIEAKHRQTCTNAHDINFALPWIRSAHVIILAASWLEWSARRLPQTLKLLNLTDDQQIFVIGAKDLGLRQSEFIRK